MTCACHALNNAHGHALATVDQFAKHWQEKNGNTRPTGPWGYDEVVGVSQEMGCDAAQIPANHWPLDAEAMETGPWKAIMLLDDAATDVTGHWTTIRRRPDGGFVALDSIKPGRQTRLTAATAAATRLEIGRAHV